MNNEENINGEKGISIDEIWLFVRRNMLLFLLVAVIGGVGGYLFSSKVVEKKYSSTAYIYTPSSSSNLSVSLEDLNLGKNLIADYIETMDSKTVINAAIKRATLAAQSENKTLSREYTYKEVAEAVSVTNPTNTHILHVTVTVANPEDAAYLANAVADEAAEQLPAIMDTKKITKYQEASPAYAPVSPNNGKYAVMSSVAFVVIAAAIQFLRMMLDTSLKCEEDVTRYLGLNTLGTVSDGHQLKKVPKEKERKKKKGEADGRR